MALFVLWLEIEKLSDNKAENCATRCMKSEKKTHKMCLGVQKQQVPHMYKYVCALSKLCTQLCGMSARMCKFVQGVNRASPCNCAPLTAHANTSVILAQLRNSYSDIPVGKDSAFIFLFLWNVEKLFHILLCSFR